MANLTHQSATADTATAYSELEATELLAAIRALTPVYYTDGGGARRVGYSLVAVRSLLGLNVASPSDYAIYDEEAISLLILRLEAIKATLDSTVTTVASLNGYYIVNGVPSSGLGSDGEMAVDEDTGRLYVKSGGSWALQSIIEARITASAISGSGFRYAYSSTITDADPGAGVFRLNNATIASATELYLDNVDQDASDISGWIDTWDDAGQTGRRGTVTLQGIDSPQAFLIARVTGTITDGTGYRKATISVVASGGTFTADEEFILTFSVAGTDGAGSGDMLSTENLNDVADKPTARSNLGLGTANSPQFTGLEIGHASDTTVTRAAAGRIAVEGSNVIMASDKASAANWRGDAADDKYLDGAAIWDSMAEVTLSDAASIAFDMSTGFDFTVTLGGNRTLANPTNPKVGQKGRIRVVQDGTGSRTLSYGSSYEFAGGSGPTLSTGAADEDILYYDVISSTRILISLVAANIS